MATTTDQLFDTHRQIIWSFYIDAGFTAVNLQALLESQYNFPSMG